MYLTTDDYWMFDDIEILSTMASDRLEKAIALISNEIDEYCNTRFEPTADVFILDACQQFTTRRRPLLEVTALMLNGATLAQNTDYFVYPEFSLIELAEKPVSNAKKAMEVHYLFGYQSVPATVKQVIIDLLKLDAEFASVSIGALQSESFDSEYSYTRSASKDHTQSELRKNILARLDLYRIAPFRRVTSTRKVRVRVI